MARTDLHKPSAAEYGDYEFLANFYLGSGGGEEAPTTPPDAAFRARLAV